MIRIASIGCGDIARRSRLPDLLQYGDRARLVAVAGRDLERLNACAAQFGAPRAYVHLDRLFAEPDIDGVLVLTPPSSHAEITLAAVAAGKHVLIEKPMTTTLESAERLLAEAEKNPVVVTPLPDVSSLEHTVVRSLVESGAVGTVTSVECHRSHRGPTHAGWFYRKDVAGGGVLVDLGIYALTAIADLFGPTERLSSLQATRFPQRTLDDATRVDVDVEDAALLNLWLESGVAVTIHATWNGYQSHHDTRTRTTVFGREGMLAFGIPGGGVYLHRDDGSYPDGGRQAELDGQQTRVYTPRSSPPGDTVLGHFIDRIERRNVDLGPLRRQVHVMEEVFAAYAASSAAGTQDLMTRF